MIKTIIISSLLLFSIIFLVFMFVPGQMVCLEGDDIIDDDLCVREDGSIYDVNEHGEQHKSSIIESIVFSLLATMPFVLPLLGLNWMIE